MLGFQLNFLTLHFIIILGSDFNLKGVFEKKIKHLTKFRKHVLKVKKSFIMLLKKHLMSDYPKNNYKNLYI